MNEYALDLTTFYKTKNIRFYLDLFGVCHGRLISQFPFDYENDVWELTEKLEDVKKKEIRTIFQLLKKRKSFFPLWRLYDYEKNWSANALIQNSQNPFHAIITEDNIDCDQLLNPSTMSSMDDLFIARRSVKIQRDANKIAEFAEKLLWMSKKIFFIDPYFKGSEREKINVLEKLLQTIDNSDIELADRVIEYHVDKEKIPSTFKNLLIQYVKPIVPNDLNIVFILRPTEEMHNRFILTNEGGLQLGLGLMEPTPMQPSTDNIGFLDFNEWQEEYKSHRNGTRLEIIELI